MMSRIEIKNWAKEYVIGKRKDLWKGLLKYFVITILSSYIVRGIGELLGFSLISILLTMNIGVPLYFIISIPLSFGLCKFTKNFVVNNTTNIHDITSLYKDTVKLVILSLLILLITMLGFICFIIPGIILSFSFTIIYYIYEDNRNLGYIELLKLSYKMMKGHKLDLFILELSFIGWIILSNFTFGLLYIWLIPYMITTLTKFFVEIENDYKKKLDK